MFKKLKEWISVQLVKNPGRMVLAGILLFNIVFFFIASGIISALSLKGTESMSFIEAAFCTITMILDPGCISFVVSDIGTAGVTITIVCVVIVVVGMISFTGAVIGYVTNYISNFIENANAGKRKLYLSNHFVLINWNSRASEIVNDMLYTEKKQRVVVLVPDRKQEIEKEIEERLADTIAQENKAVMEKYKDLGYFARKRAIRKNRFKRNVTVLVREGDVFSSKQLRDIALDKARSIIVLEGDINGSSCKYETAERKNEMGKGNSLTVKTLMQVADITAAESSADNQRIIVEITDVWTWDIVSKIIKAKQVEGKCNIIPVRVNEVLGQILSQFCLMPELNAVYSELFSNKGAEFYSEQYDGDENEIDFVKNYYKEHNHALPVTIMEKDNKRFAYYLCDSYKDVYKKSSAKPFDYPVELKKEYWLEQRKVIILGHNSKSKFIMDGFEAFSREWKRGDEEIVDILVVDNKESLEKMNYYKEYPFVSKTVQADIYEKDLLCSTIEQYVDEHNGDISILILSDDMVSSDNLDAGALANLVYVRDIIDKKTKENDKFVDKKIDVIVEIINPKHHDIVNSYSIKNVVISNRYISKMVTQISEVEALYDLYNDILSYDEEGAEEYSSKEVYVKKVWRYFETMPTPTTAEVFVRAIFEESIKKDKYGYLNPTIVLGYVKDGKITIFSGDLSRIPVDLKPSDKVILFSPH
ncbi:MAG: hypothetical protein II988_06415 [Clostridia bacterium]|nr:hypothetical protein [Clostridia bacterium]